MPQTGLRPVDFFIDQFEELFTLVAECHRQPFINLLEKAVQSPYLRIILTVRADFHEHCLNYPALTQLINIGNWHLAPPDFRTLADDCEPAKAAGLQFESGLIEQILTDTGTGSGALALMAFALEQLYLACRATTLTCEAYDRLAGSPGRLVAMRRKPSLTWIKMPKMRWAKYLPSWSPWILNAVFRLVNPPI